MVKAFLSLVSLWVLGCTASVADLSQTSLVYIAPAKSAFMTIPSNQSTGYSWYMMQINSDKMRVINPSGTYTASDSGISGAGGFQTFEIECSSLCVDGDIEQFELIYSRPWEKVITDIKKISLMVTTDPTLA